MKLGSLANIRSWPRLVPQGRARVAAAVLGVLTLAGALIQIGVTMATALPSDAVLRIGDVVLTDDDYRRRVDVLEALYGVRQPDGGAELDRFRRDAAKSIAVSMILDRAAADRDVIIADKVARDALTKIVETQLPDGREAFTKFLSGQGLSERNVLDEVKRQLSTNRLIEQVSAPVKPVSDAEVRKTYQKRKADMVTPERRQLRNIVVASEQKAKSVLAQAKSGADFARLAAHSLDESTKQKGGNLGRHTADELDKAFAKAAFDAPEKSVFGPVQTEFGWNVGYVAAIEPGKPLSFEQVAERLEKELNSKRKLDAWRTWLAEQIKKANVEYADAYRPAHPDAPPSAPTPAARSSR